MDAERAQDFLLTLPHVVATQQWGDNLVFWVGDKAIGGKMFVLLDLSGALTGGVASFAAGPERAAELCEVDGLRPAPYLARAHWVAANRWSVVRDAEWHELFSAAHGIVAARLTKKTAAALALPVREQKALIREKRALLAAKKKS